MKRVYLVVLIFIVFLVSCSTKDAKNQPDLLKISAAVSMSDALEEIKQSYEQENNIELSLNLAGSGTLAQQIQQGAPVDVFISANEQWMDILENEQLIFPETRTNITGNQLVLIANKKSAFSYKSFADIELDNISHIAVGNPDSVPAGKYTKDALLSIGKWDSLQDKIIFAKDVRQVLTYVATGNADLGFVYESDALSSSEITILATSEASDHKPIIYPAAVVQHTKNKHQANEFVQFMLTKESQAIFKKHGFKN